MFKIDQDDELLHGLLDNNVEKDVLWFYFINRENKTIKNNKLKSKWTWTWSWSWTCCCFL